jgi:hypothetical protein
VQLQLNPTLWAGRQVNIYNTLDMINGNEDDDDDDDNDSDSNDDCNDVQRQVSKYALPVVHRLLLQDVSASAQALVRLGDILLHGRHKQCRA